MGDEVFVFGSNRAGRHGAGAARFAHEKYGARMGVGEGMTGRSYALPTKDAKVETLSLEEVAEHVRKFIVYARNAKSLRFRLTAIGCGLAGFTAEQIAPMFSNAPLNVRLPPEFRDQLPDLPDERFWSEAEFAVYQK